ncbi:hypothetical protein AAY473_032780 [Plecturocebus cupreus]
MEWSQQHQTGGPGTFQTVPKLSPNEGGDASPTSFQAGGCTRPLRMPGGGSCQFTPPFLLLPGSSGGRLKAGLWRLIKQVSLLLRGRFNQGDAMGGIISCTRSGAHGVAREEPLSGGSRGGTVHASGFALLYRLECSGVIMAYCSLNLLRSEMRSGYVAQAGLELLALRDLLALAF